MMNLHLYIRNIVFCLPLLTPENCLYIIHQSMSIDSLLYYLFSRKLYIILLHTTSEKTFNLAWLHSVGLFTLKSSEEGSKEW